MIPHLLVTLVALLAAALTLVSGFGLGTILLPVFALFFPIEIAVAATAIVHLANNLFKIGLVGRQAHWPTVARFGIPAAVGALLGAEALVRLGALPPVASYTLGGGTHTITAVHLVVGSLIFVFALFELLPVGQRIGFGRQYLGVGGALSGFFGGVSGHQGALRSAFLIKAGLTKEQYIGTGAICAVCVDVARLAVYGMAFVGNPWAELRTSGALALVATGTLAAFLGSFFGARLLPRLTLASIRLLIGVLLLVMSLAIATALV